MRAPAPAIAAVLLALARQRAPDRTFCPSDAARRLFPDAWRGRMDEVRAEAARLAAAGLLRVTQGGREVSGGGPWRGPVRLSAGPRLGLDAPAPETILPP